MSQANNPQITLLWKYSAPGKMGWVQICDNGEASYVNMRLALKDAGYSGEGDVYLKLLGREAKRALAEGRPMCLNWKPRYLIKIVVPANVRAAISLLNEANIYDADAKIDPDWEGALELVTREIELALRGAFGMG